MIDRDTNQIRYASEVSINKNRFGTLTIKNKSFDNNEYEKTINISIVTKNSSFIKKTVYFFRKDIIEFTYNNQNCKIDTFKLAKALNISKPEANRLIKNNQAIEKIKEITFCKTLYETGNIKYWEYVKLIDQIISVPGFTIANKQINENTKITVEENENHEKIYITDKTETKCISNKNEKNPSQSQLINKF